MELAMSEIDMNGKRRFNNLFGGGSDGENLKESTFYDPVPRSITTRIAALREVAVGQTSNSESASSSVVGFGNFGNDWGKDNGTGFDNFNQFGKD
jgi:hypothetical protein